jgi:hypothetical protein
MGMSMGDTARKGVDSIRGIFKNLKNDFLESTVANFKGKIPKAFGQKIKNFSLHTLADWGSSIVTDGLNWFLGKSINTFTENFIR